MEQECEENDEPKFKTIRYKKHGILKEIRGMGQSQNWVFTSSDTENSFETFTLIEVLETLCEEGYELVCHSEDGYILRTKEEVEEEIEYYED